MKFTCTKDNLIHALDLVSPLAGKHAHLPILSNVLLQVSNSKVEFISTNLEVAIKTSIRAKVDKEGSFTVPAKTLNDYVRLLNQEQVEIELDNNELVISGGSSRTKIKGASSEEYPVIPGVEEENAYVVDVEVLKEGLSKTVLAASKNEIRPELAGVYFNFFSERYGGLLLAATDSYRLAESKVALMQGDKNTNCIVSARVVYEIIRLLTVAKGIDADKQVRLWVSSNQIAIRFDAFEMTARLVQGKYPDYSQIIPTTFKTKAVFPVDVMVNKIKAASIFTTTGINAVSIDLSVSEHNIGISSTNNQTGEHLSEMEAELSGEENSILLNHRYVLDGLQNMGEVGILQVNAPDAPCMFTPEKRIDYLYIVMPIRQ